MYHVGCVMTNHLPCFALCSREVLPYMALAGTCGQIMRACFIKLKKKKKQGILTL